MIGVIVTIGPAADLDRARASAVAEGARPMFEGMDGLRSKVFMWNEQAGTVTNTYVWDSEDAARAFFSPELKQKIVEKKQEQDLSRRLDRMSLRDLGFKLLEIITQYRPTKRQLRAIVDFALHLLSYPTDPDEPDKPAS